MYHMLLEVRMLGWAGRAEQAGDLADAFHKLPACLYSDAFDWSVFRHFLQAYHAKYPAGSAALYDYLAMLDSIAVGTFPGPDD